MRGYGNSITYAAQDHRSGQGPRDSNNGSPLKGHIHEAGELMRKVANGDVAAFERIYEEFCPILRRLFANCDDLHMSLDDFTQEVFTRLWQQRKNYRSTSCLLAYLFDIARYT